MIYRSRTGLTWSPDQDNCPHEVYNCAFAGDYLNNFESLSHEDPMIFTRRGKPTANLRDEHGNMWWICAECYYDAFEPVIFEDPDLTEVLYGAR